MEKKGIPLRLLQIGIVSFALILILLFIRKFQEYPVPTPLILLIGVLLALFIGASRLSKKVQTRFLMLIISTFLTVYAVEMYLFIKGNPFDGLGERGMAALRSGVPYDKRKPIDVVDELLEDGDTAVPYISPKNFVSEMPMVDGDPLYALSGIANETTVYCNESGQYELYESDRYGLNNPDSIWDQLPLEFALVGDSFAQGNCVAREDSIAGLIRKQYPKTITAGADGNGPMGALASLKEYVGETNPDTVLWFWYEGNDMDDLYFEKFNYVLNKYIETDFTQDLRNRQDDVDEARYVYLERIRTHLAETAELEKARRPKMFFASLKLYQIRKMMGWTFEDETEESEDEWDSVSIPDIKTTHRPKPLGRNANEPFSVDEECDYLTVKEEINDCENLQYLYHIWLDAYYYTSSWGGNMYIVYLPSFERLSAEDPYAPLKFRDEILDIVDTTPIEIIDTLPYLLEHENPVSLFPFEIDGHFNEEGYKYITEYVLEQVELRSAEVEE